MTDARRALLGELIDHAPLFPPASLPLEEALEDHRRARESEQAWMVRRFVAPASLLEDLPRNGLRLSLIVDAPVDPNDERVEAVEGRGDPRVLARLCSEAYVEIPPGDTEFVGDIARAGARAKVRCGESVPSVDELAEFVRACRDAGVPFKATAGLHHAVRTDSEHGFLNLLAAVVFGDEEAALAEGDEESFRFDEEAFAWGDRHASTDELTNARQELFSGIGSCSFTEPVEDLKRLRLL